MPTTLTFEKLVRKFWSRVDKGTGDDSCWIWTGVGSGSHGDYGTFVHARKKFYAHRFSYEITFGNIPEGLKVLHKCDTPRCVNPNHLFLGTMSDNSYDMVRKGRHGCKTHPEKFASRFNHPATHLTKEDILKIRELCTTDMYQRDIAKMFNISQSTVSDIHNHKRWCIV